MINVSLIGVITGIKGEEWHEYLNLLCNAKNSVPVAKARQYWTYYKAKKIDSFNNDEFEEVLRKEQEEKILKQHRKKIEAEVKNSHKEIDLGSQASQKTKPVKKEENKVVFYFFFKFFQLLVS